ncbi:hypothetical protein B7463_g4764, partial [Scytalidium lignicola]
MVGKNKDKNTYGRIENRESCHHISASITHRSGQHERPMPTRGEAWRMARIEALRRSFSVKTTLQVVRREFLRRIENKVRRALNKPAACAADSTANLSACQMAARPPITTGTSSAGGNYGLVDEAPYRSAPSQKMIQSREGSNDRNWPLSNTKSQQSSPVWGLKRPLPPKHALRGSRVLNRCKRAQQQSPTSDLLT